MNFPQRMKTIAKLAGQFVAGVVGTVATSAACIAILVWAFACAFWQVVILGQEAEELL